MVGIVLLAMVAAFLALRLYSVLGKRTGHEQTFVAPIEPRRVEVDAAVPAKPVVVDLQNPSVEADAVAGVRAIGAADGSFDPPRFLEGAKSAYRMIIEAFWRGDEQAFEGLVSAEVRDAFSEAIRERGEAGHVLDNRLIAIERAVITHASVEERMAHVTVRFDADVAAVTRDTEGKVLAGSLTDALTTHDSWTFSRELRSADPNWVLTDTDEQ